MTELKGDPRFRELLDKMWEVHCKKACDYGNEVKGDFLSNLRASKDVGVNPSLGAWMRGKDKVQRIDSWFRKGWVANETVQDSLIDLAAYCMLTLILLQEEWGDSSEIHAEKEV